MHGSNWRPSASISSLRLRAKIIARIRTFFDERNVLEVDTPLLSHATVTDPHVLSIPAIFQASGSTNSATVYLQTSPEYAMKRLLAAGSGPIFQICKAFRQGDLGRIHNPEFTLLEWYRPGFDHHDLMNEMDQLLQFVLNVPVAERLSYAEVFANYTGINPHTASVAELMEVVRSRCNVSLNMLNEGDDRNLLLNLLLTHCIEPQIGQERPIFLYDFPVSQAALAKIRNDVEPPVASRFEVYFKGLELANGFHELQNPVEQRQRFENDLSYRERQGVAAVPVDEQFLAALQAGLPDCAGVALGFDRLVMLALEAASLRDVISFGFEC